MDPERTEKSNTFAPRNTKECAVSLCFIRLAEEERSLQKLARTNGEIALKMILL